MDALSDGEIVALAEREMANRGWVLAGEPSLFAPGESFARRVLARAAQWATQRDRPRDAALAREVYVHEYCLLLHAAVGHHGSHAQQRALEETYRYGYSLALRRLGDEARADAVTWSAVMKMWRAVAGTGRMNDPGSYLAYFTTVLRNEVWQELRRTGRVGEHEEPLDAADERDGADGPRDEDTADPGAPDPALAVEIDDAHAEVWQALSDCLKNPRREYILFADMSLGFNASEIARHVKTTVQAVYMAKFQAIEHIREHCAEVMKRLLRELSALRAESAGRA
jgi:DNA-directed RNA polymerase specialized sigma24 family protein